MLGLGWIFAGKHVGLEFIADREWQYHWLGNNEPKISGFCINLTINLEAIINKATMENIKIANHNQQKLFIAYYTAFRSGLHHIYCTDWKTGRL
jgi:hypothetical protein